MSNQLPLPMTYDDSIALREYITLAVERGLLWAASLRHEPPTGPALTHIEQDVTGTDGVTRRERIPIKRSGKATPHVDGPRYEAAAIDAELAMILHRAAVRLGLYETGVEAKLLIALNRAEEEIARLRGAADPVAEAAAAVGAVALAAATVTR